MARKWWTLAAVATGVFMLVLDITIVNVALPDIGRDFRSPLSGLQWVIDAYALVLAAGLLTAGSLADLLGRRRLYATGGRRSSPWGRCCAGSRPGPCSW
jgi:MFS family permease